MNGSTFSIRSGIDGRYVSNEELAIGAQRASDNTFWLLRRGIPAREGELFGMGIIEGAIPETLPQVTTRQIAFCHIDMNCSPPEVAALSCFWDRLVPGDMALRDDYAHYGYQPSKDGMDGFAEERG